MSEKIEYYTVGKLREVLKDISDDTPVVSAPLNDNVRVALDISIVKNGKLGDYKGDVVVFNTGLFDIETGNSINLIPPEEK